MLKENRCTRLKSEFISTIINSTVWEGGGTESSWLTAESETLKTHHKPWWVWCTIEVILLGEDVKPPVPFPNVGRKWLLNVSDFIICKEDSDSIVTWQMLPPAAPAVSQATQRQEERRAFRHVGCISAVIECKPWLGKRFQKKVIVYGINFHSWLNNACWLSELGKNPISLLGDGLIDSEGLIGVKDKPPYLGINYLSVLSLGKELSICLYVRCGVESACLNMVK